MEKRKVPFTLTEVHDGRKYDCAVDYNEDGTVTIWIPYGARVTRHDAQQVVDLLKGCNSEQSEERATPDHRTDERAQGENGASGLGGSLPQ